MKPRDLEFFGTDELIEEILSRTTFQGVIVHSRDEAKSPQWTGERIFNVRHNANLQTEQAGRLLDVVCQYMTTE